MNREGSVERSREQFNMVYETVYGGIIMIHIEEVSVILMLMFGVVVSYFICTVKPFLLHCGIQMICKSVLYDQDKFQY